VSICRPADGQGCMNWKRWSPPGRGSLAIATGLAAAVCTLPASAAAPAADGIHWVLHPHPTVMHYQGDTYRIQLWITDGSWRAGPDGREREQAVKIIISSRNHVSAELHAVQKHFYSFVIDRSRQRGFVHPSTAAASVHASEHSYGTLRLDLTFASTASRVTSCGGHTVYRRGRISGSLFFRPPHSSIGSVSGPPAHATLRHGDGSCEIGRTPEPKTVSGTPCPTTTYVATGESSPSNNIFSFVARRDPDGDTASIVAASNNSGPPYVWHTIEAVVPASRVQVASDLSSITIKGGRGSFLSGTAKATKSGPPTPWIAPAGCPSHSPAEGSLQAPEGNYTGDLTANFFLGRPRGVAGTQVAAHAYVDLQPK
jgi:hypothetical protein